MTVSETEALASRVARVRESIAEAAQRAGRQPRDIALVAATKMNDAEHVRAALRCGGIFAAGENRVQELLTKYEQGAYEGVPLHFIGTLQSNKVKFLVGKTALIQSVSSIKLAQTIAKEAARQGLRQEILLEVNIGREAAKSGFDAAQLEGALPILAAESGIHICGLMAIPPIANGFGKNIRYFAEMQQLFVDISTKKYDNISMNILSMGMSGDYAEAIACGSNMVRIGSAIFGARQYGAEK